MDDRIHLDLHTTRDEFEDQDEVEVEVAFEIPLDSRLRALSIVGIVSNAIGLLLFLGMAVLTILAGPSTWFNWGGDLAASQIFKERMVLLALGGATFLLAGLAMYTFGRTVMGGEELAEEEYA